MVDRRAKHSLSYANHLIQPAFAHTWKRQWPNKPWLLQNQINSRSRAIGAGFVRVSSRFVHPSAFPRVQVWWNPTGDTRQGHCNHIMPTTISATINPILYNSPLHGLQGPAYGPPGSANAKQTRLGLQVIQADSLSTVYWWLAVIVINIHFNSRQFWWKWVIVFDKDEKTKTILNKCNNKELSHLFYVVFPSHAALLQYNVS